VDIRPADGLSQYPSQKSRTSGQSVKGIEDAPYSGCTTTSPVRGGRHVRPVSRAVVDRAGQYGRGRSDQPGTAAGPVHRSAGVRAGRRRPHEECLAESDGDALPKPIEVGVQVTDHVADALEVREPVGKRHTHDRLANRVRDQAAGYRLVDWSGRACRWRSSAGRPDPARRLAIRRQAYLIRYRGGRTGWLDLETPNMRQSRFRSAMWPTSRVQRTERESCQATLGTRMSSISWDTTHGRRPTAAVPTVC
jgi:hypothetical protein